MLVLVVVIGPQRLPEYTRKLTQWVRQLRLFLDNAKAQIAEEVGPELADLNLQDLNPRNYDPRKIVRDALGEDLDAIRRDLSQPFESFASAAKESGDAAAKAVKEDTRSRHGSKSLSSMIDDKAEETRKAANPKVAAAGAATAAAGAKVAAAAAQRESLEEAAAEADAVTVEMPQVAAPEAASTEDAPVAQEPVDALTDEQAEAAVGAARGAGVLPGLTEESTTRHRAARALADDAAFAVVPDDEPQAAEEEPAREGEPDGDAVQESPEPRQEAAPEQVEDPERRGLISGAVGAVVGAAQAVEGAVDLVPDEEIPSTLVAGAPRAARVRPLSPRDVVRASAAAARTSREALTAAVD
nr:MULTISPECIES: Sec-independent protein translocase TatB [unclassified Actinomyces]